MPIYAGRTFSSQPYAKLSGCDCFTNVTNKLAIQGEGEPSVRKVPAQCFMSFPKFLDRTGQPNFFAHFQSP